MNRRAEQAVKATPDDHTDLAAMLNNLDNKLQSRFERNGSSGRSGNAIFTIPTLITFQLRRREKYKSHSKIQTQD